jgi:hypothetical protein
MLHKKFNFGASLVAAVLGLTSSHYCVADVRSPVVIAVDGFAKDLTPPTTYGTYNNWILLHAARRLTDDQFSRPIAGDLASSWFVNPKTSTITFTLRKDLGTFCDGTLVTPTSVIDSFKYALRIGSRSGRLQHFYSSIRSIRLINGADVEFSFSPDRPVSSYFRFFSDPAASVFLPEAKTSPCLAGRYRIADLKNDSVTLNRKSDGQAFTLRAMQFSKAEQGLRDGTVHIVPTYSYFQGAILGATGATNLTLRDGKTYFFAFNTESPLFSSVKSRKSIAGCIDRNRLENFVRAHQMDTASHIFINQRLEAPPLDRGNCDVNLLKRLRIITQAGHAMIPLLNAALPELQSSQVRELSKDEFVEHAKSNRYDLAILGFSSAPRDGSGVVRTLEPGAPWNVTHTRDSEILKNLKLLASYPGPEKLALALRRIEQRSRELFLHIPIGYKATEYFISDRIRTRDELNSTQGRGASIFLNLDDILGAR